MQPAGNILQNFNVSIYVSHRSFVDFILRVKQSFQVLTAYVPKH